MAVVDPADGVDDGGGGTERGAARPAPAAGLRRSAGSEAIR
ncbi:hypothetical protein [Paracoccus sp. SCSIO 75233]|nr:hypothetical protein [Paracoccus sp. SCSIO 75233]WBU53109.1 hypothetical protein PAF12_15030 [Paracoccus sp. SCSIO 75233]